MDYGIAKKKKMSQKIDLCEDSDDNGERPNTASAPSLPLSGKRPRDRNTTGSTAFGVDLKLADEMEISVSRHKKRRGVMRGERRAKKDAAEECAHILKRVPGSEKDVGSEDSEQTSRDDGSINKHSQKLAISKQPSNACRSGNGGVFAWEDRLSELADYHKIYGHCNVPYNCSENTKLANWVGTQRRHYKLHVEGKTSRMTLSRIQELENLGVEWDCHRAVWDDRLSELADYRKIHGHCNVPRKKSSENSKLGNWVATQRQQYNLHVKGNASSMTLSRIQELESLDFEWKCKRSLGSVWGDSLSELAFYRKIHGHCNVPQKRYSEQSKLGNWVGTQKKQYNLHVKGKRSSMTLSRIQQLEGLGFEWDNHSAAWGDRLSELADYRKIHGHCNVPARCSENLKLATWVATQRSHYRLQLEGKISHMTLARIQELESLGFEWDRRGASWEKV
jgi:hypothetical protein